MTILKVPRIPETIDFLQEETKVLKLWQNIDAFRSCLKQSKDKPKYSFFDGPPFATGLPHYGHILAGTIKDVVTRYAHQQGYHVERRFGWDCHGLPVEFEIDKMLGVKGPEDVQKMGIAAYNDECRKIITRYVGEWEECMTRLGRWIDFENDYKTLYPWYMESIWWVFKQLYDKGLVYRGSKVMPYSTACCTPLSNFESGQNYKMVIDPAITVSFPVIEDVDGASLLIWTTTPWTLPSNLSACVNPRLEYVKFVQISTRKCFIMLEARIETVFPKNDWMILKKMTGKELEGLRYQPPFNYYEHLRDTRGAFRVLTDDYVTADSGTGIVHQAPYFGEDDFRVCLTNGLITKDQEPICPVDASGRFTDPIRDFKGIHVKDADKSIINFLKQKGLLVNHAQVNHNYPFCWRSDTPLIYRSVPSWFIRVEQMKGLLEEASDATYWVPEFVRDKRFGNWLREARDWAVSRNRYWGTPIPLWVSPNFDEVICVGSIQELCELTGRNVEDLHRESIDDLVIPSRVAGGAPLRRIDEVFDCWFESGSMPYAQLHYPFENRKEFWERFPADFVAEGIDQTRGWFYTLLVISVALFGRAPFKNLIANGLVLASDGQKMSKRKQNYPDPMEIVNKYGADALRLYLISSPVVRAENLRFKEEGVRDVVKDVFLPWYNAFRFLMQNLESYGHKASEFYQSFEASSDNIMDRWILSFTQSLLEYVRSEMGLYHLYNVIPRLIKYFDHLTNWYIRMNRKRFKESGTKTSQSAVCTLLNILTTITKMMAPFAPFLSETIFQYLRQLTATNTESVHYVMFPKPNVDLIDTDIELAMTRMQTIIDLVRVIRDRKAIPLKYPLPELIIVHQNQNYLSDVKALKNYIISELNVRKLTTSSDETTFGISMKVEPNYKTLGLKLKSNLKPIAAVIKQLGNFEINYLLEQGYVEILGHQINLEDLKLTFQSTTLSRGQFEINSDNDVVVLLDVTPDESMQNEGIAREIINRVQKLRKKAHLVPTDVITVFHECGGALERIVAEYSGYIEGAIKAPFKPKIYQASDDDLIIEETQQVKGNSLYLAVMKKLDLPHVRWCNLHLIGFQPRLYNSNKATILMEFKGIPLTLQLLRKEIMSLFGVDTYSLWVNGEELLEDEQLKGLSAGTIFICRVGKMPDEDQPTFSRPVCKYLNFERGGINGTLLLENPQGNQLLYAHEKVIRDWVEK